MTSDSDMSVRRGKGLSGDKGNPGSVAKYGFIRGGHRFFGAGLGEGRKNILVGAEAV